MMLHDNKNSRRRKKVISEINVTPFVDVLLVILIIFMVTAPMLKTGFDVSLPKADKSFIKNAQDEKVIISIDKSSNIYIEKTLFDEKSLMAYINKYDKEKTQFFIKADKEVKYQSVISVMGKLNQQGFLNISLVTETN